MAKISAIPQATSTALNILEKLNGSPEGLATLKQKGKIAVSYERLREHFGDVCEFLKDGANQSRATELLEAETAFARQHLTLQV